jgi:hypothetical protein
MQWDSTESAYPDSQGLLLLSAIRLHTYELTDLHVPTSLPVHILHLTVEKIARPV